MPYLFQPFLQKQSDQDPAAKGTVWRKVWSAVPELTDGFDPTLPSPPSGMVPLRFYTEKVDLGIYRIHIRLEAVKDIQRLYLFTGRRQLRKILSMKKGEHLSASYLLSAAEIIPRYQEDVRPVEHLFLTLCTEDPSALKVGECYGVPAERSYTSDPPGSAKRPKAPPRIFLCGDSTVTDHPSEIPYHPGACYAAWGQALPAFLPDTAIENQAHCGLTTEDFLKQGHFAIVVHHIRPGDICLFQFGHNDQKLPHLWADRGYPVNLRYFVKAIREKARTRS